MLEFAGEGPIDVHHDRPLDENLDLVPLQMQVDVVERESLGGDAVAKAIE